MIEVQPLDICTQDLYSSYAYDYPMDSQETIFRYFNQEGVSSSNSSDYPNFPDKAKKLPRDSKGRFIKGYSYNPETQFKKGHIFKHTEETKRKLSIAHKGKKVSLETRRKQSEAKKRLFEIGKLNLPNTKGLKAWNLGIPHSENTRLLISQNIKRFYEKNPYRNIKNIFESWTPESLWVLGMLATDGWINRNGISFSGKEEDMKKIKIIFNGTQKILKNKTCHSFTVGNRLIMENMVNNINIPRKKSLILQYPNVPKDYESTRHFIRGVFDGDGCVSQQRIKTTKRIIPYVIASICSASEPFIKDCIELLSKFGVNSHFDKRKCKLTPNNIIKKANISYMYKLQITSKDILTFYEFLYKGVSDNILSNYKKDKFDKLLKEFNEANSVDYRKRQNGT